MDVYAFGVVLYELISAKEAIIKTNEVVSESKGLVALVLSLSSSSNLYICVYIYIYICSFTEIQTNPIQCLIIEQFEDTFNQPDPQECLRKLVDPRIGDDYPIESVRKVMNRLINQDLFLV